MHFSYQKLSPILYLPPKNQSFLSQMHLLCRKVSSVLCLPLKINRFCRKCTSCRKLSSIFYPPLKINRSFHKCTFTLKFVFHLLLITANQSFPSHMYFSHQKMSFLLYLPLETLIIKQKTNEITEESLHVPFACPEIKNTRAQSLKK